MELKSKGILAVSSMALVAITLTATVVINNNSMNMNQNQNIAVKSEKLDVRNQGAAITGNAFYVNLNQVSGWWFTNSETWAYFWHEAGEDAGVGYAKEEAWVQIDTSSSVPNDTNVFEVAVPGGYTNNHYWTNVIVTRSSGGAGDATWSNIWNQSENESVDSNGLNGVTVKHDGSENKVKPSDGFSYTAATRIEKWAAASGEWTSTGICHDIEDEGIDTTLSALEASWGRTATTFGNIVGADVKSYFSNVPAGENDTAARYDHIMERYGFANNFASR